MANSARRKFDGSHLIFNRALKDIGLAEKKREKLLQSVKVVKTLDPPDESHPSNARDLPNELSSVKKENSESLQTSDQEKHARNSVLSQKHQSNNFNESNSGRNFSDSSDRTLHRNSRHSSDAVCVSHCNYEKNAGISGRNKSQHSRFHDTDDSHMSRKSNSFVDTSYRHEHDDRINQSKPSYNHKKYMSYNSDPFDKRCFKKNSDFPDQHDFCDRKSSFRTKNPQFTRQVSRGSSSNHSSGNFYKQNVNRAKEFNYKDNKDRVCIQKDQENESQGIKIEEYSTNFQSDVRQDNESQSTTASDCSNARSLFNESSDVDLVSGSSVISNEFKDCSNTGYCVDEASEASSVCDSGITSQTCTDLSVLSDSLNFANNVEVSLSLESRDETILLSLEEENFIPPPTVLENLPTSSSTSSEKNENSSLQNESVEDIFSTDFDSDHVEAISDFIITTVKEHSVSSCHSIATKVVYDLNILFRNHFEGSPIDYYGSYDTDLAIGTSDINLVMKPDKSVRNSFMYEVYKILSNELEKYHVHPFEEGKTAHTTKINFIHPETGVNCQLAYLGRYRENVLEMGNFFKWICLRDKRAKTLIIAVKIWAESLNINEVEDGKLHPIGYALLVIHFLQHCEKPVLPIYGELDDLSENNASLGELWMGFLRYYSVTFNWKKYIVTVNSKGLVPKKTKNWENFWIAIEDPFTGKNVAESVKNSDVADYIKACFKSSYESFANPQVSSPSCEEKEESGAESSKPRFEFSFQKCFVEQDDTYCEMCEEIDDFCDECQKKNYVPPMTTLPKMTENFLEKVKKVLEKVYEPEYISVSVSVSSVNGLSVTDFSQNYKYILTNEEVEERKNFVEKLQREIQNIYPGAQLKLFGSSTNGFGFKNSDLDICMMLKNKDKTTSAAVLKDLRYRLRRDKKFDHVIAVFNAKIPILKFHYQPKSWRGDISLANTLAVYNSELLYTYSQIDERCKILGCAFKLLAKKALISEVTDKALSSYAYLIMVIHFLQQTDPPVLPVLQDNEYRNNYQLEDIVEDCNIWFCKDISYIKEVFQTKNDTPVEQLFLELLDYYCSLDYNKFITIRQKEIQLVGKKQRLARLFNIQDPFIETKNLGCVVCPKKAQETKSVLTRARQLFRKPVDELPSGVNDLEDYFFSTMSLTGRMHKEAICDLCGKFGHEQKECQHNSFFQLQKSFYTKHFIKPNSHGFRHVSYKKPFNRHMRENFKNM